MHVRLIAITGLALIAAALPVPTALAAGPRQIEEVAPPPEPTLAELPVLEPSYRPTNAVSWTARLVAPVTARSVPGAGLLGRGLKTWVPGTGNPLELMILERRADAEGEPWLKVLMPYRPNGLTGWIPEAATIVRRNPVLVVISLRRHTLTVYRDGRKVHRVGVALGAPDTPTPKGRFAVYQEVREPGFSPLGPWALHLTAHSNVLFEYAGGPGRVAIHGARGALWAEAGTNPSHGCIRVPDPGIGRVAALVTPGTPVVIRG
ncbi:MAG: L,D-transpeptidase [Actinomycetota bacterium]